MRPLTRRSGDVKPTLQEQIRSLSLAQLETLGEDLLDFGQPIALVAWLDRQKK